MRQIIEFDCDDRRERRIADDKIDVFGFFAEIGELPEL